MVKISILIFSSILSFILLEISYRYLIFGSDSLNYEKMNSVTPLGLSGLIEPSPDPEIVYQLKPNLDTYFKMAKFTTNSKGLRDEEYSMTKPKNTIRVAVVGDSLTMPAGVDIEDAYHSILEQQFKTSCLGKNYEFINFAVGGYYLSQYWAVIQKNVMDWDPDMILIGFCEYNDFEIPPEELFERPYRVKEKGHPFFFKSFAIDGIKQFIKNLWKTGLHNKQAINGSPNLKAEQVDYVRKVFSDIGALSSERKIPIVVTNLGITPNEHEELGDIVTSSGLYYFDSTAYFDGTSVLKYSIYPSDNHPNSEAHQLFASGIKAYLESTQLIQCDGVEK